ncbi:MAG TPA: glucose 1-dehydrogenase [Terriglobia bacterium]|nr:glucose 1-dehydrogenase [Terriglobia bacterium]
MKLEDRVAIITGSASGIGRASAGEFAREGAQVVVADINITGAQETVKQIEAAGGVGLAVSTDVADSGSVEALIEQTLRTFGRINVLFNNAAIQVSKTVEDTTVEEWNREISINLGGVFLCSKFAIPHLRRTKGCIVNMASVNGYFVEPQCAGYCATKGGIIALTKAMAIDHGKDGIRVNCICPGYIDSGLAWEYFKVQPDPAEARNSAGKLHALWRVGQPEEVARLAVFLASDDASFMTGSSVTVSGGFGFGLPPAG